MQQMSVKHHEIKRKNVNHLHGHMPEDACHFPTKQSTSSPCSWNH